MARLTDSTVLRHPETGEPTFLEVGSEVPEWASGLIGDHLVADSPEAPPAKKATPRKRAAKSDD